MIVEKEKGLVWTMASDWQDDPRWEKYREKVEDVRIDEYGVSNSDWHWG